MSLLLQIFARNGLCVLLTRVSAPRGIATLFALKKIHKKMTRTIMGKLLTPDMFSRVKDKCTSKGYGIDQLIECGLNYDTMTNKLKME